MDNTVHCFFTWLKIYQFSISNLKTFEHLNLIKHFIIVQHYFHDSRMQGKKRSLGSCRRTTLVLISKICTRLCKSLHCFCKLVPSEGHWHVLKKHSHTSWCMFQQAIRHSQMYSMYDLQINYMKDGVVTTVTSVTCVLEQKGFKAGVKSVQEGLTSKL